MLSFGQIDLAPKRECVAINTARDLVCIIVELAIRYAGCEIYGSIRHLAKLCTLIKKNMILYAVMSTTCGRPRDPLCSSKCRGSVSLRASGGYCMQAEPTSSILDNPFESLYAEVVPSFEKLCLHYKKIKRRYRVIVRACSG